MNFLFRLLGSQEKVVPEGTEIKIESYPINRYLEGNFATIVSHHFIDNGKEKLVMYLVHPHYMPYTFALLSRKQFSILKR